MNYPIKLWSLCTVFASLFFARFAPAAVSDSTNLDQGWRLWLDPTATWKDDTLYLPEDVDLAKIPANPPTGGWSVLTDQAGINVSLPSTVEEHYWATAPSHTTSSTRPTDIVNLRGNYLGVSWWYRPFTPPALAKGERVVFYFPAARLRSEVYVNGKLVGYNIISEAPFTADATDALNPNGPNLLAVRITNPGGQLDWIDFMTLRWGKYTLPSTHGFGGLAGGVEMQTRGPVSVSDLAVFNKPDPHTVHLQAQVSSTGAAYDGPVQFSITRDGNTLFTGGDTVHVPAGETASVAIDATVNNAQLWDIGKPNLYDARASLPSVPHSDRATTFGFRWFTAKGVGTHANLYLNDRRIVPRSSISWGFWAPNGIFPDAAAAQREINAMKAIGLDSIQNHRHMPKAVVLDAFDHAGFLRYCEAGSGILSFQNGTGDAQTDTVPTDTTGDGSQMTFLNKYQLDKELAMIRADRSHPSVSLWTLQNETSPDLNNPKLFYVLNKMREADPSRIIALKSGVTPDNQVWTLPYSNEWLHEDGKGYSGWWDQHTANDSPGVWQDGMYQSPTEFKYDTDNKKEIVAWGEMATGASPDDHAAMVNWYTTSNRTGYDLLAHQTILSSYEKFLDQYQFRSAFPTAESLFRAAAAKHYFSAAHILEDARIADNIDYIVLSGWESTSIENHSGMVDSLRQLKSDPSLIKQASQPEVIVIRPRHYVIAKGDTALVDIHQVNEENWTGPRRLTITVSTPQNEKLFESSYQVELLGGETYGQLLKENIQFPVNATGLLTIHAALSPADGGDPVLQRDEQILAVDTQPAPLTQTIACGGNPEDLVAALKDKFNANAVPLTSDLGKVSTILLATHSGMGDWRATNGTAKITNTDDPGLFRQQMYGLAGPVQAWHGLAPGKITVILYFADTFQSAPGRRLFDIAINGQTVAKDFDIIAEAGGRNRAMVKSFDVDAPDGNVTLSVPAVKADNASFAAIELHDSAGKIIREVFRNQRYIDSKNNVWTPIASQGNDDLKPSLEVALQRARNDGSRVIVLTRGGRDAEDVASYLAEQKLLNYSGMVGPSGSSWLGFWYFARKHWLFDGLPSDCVLDWQYQIGTGNAPRLSGDGIEAVVAYGRNHDPNIGIAAASISCGKGQVLFLAVPGLMDAFLNGRPGGFHPVTARRMIFNALNAPPPPQN